MIHYHKGDVQLYNLINQLSSSIDHTDHLGTAVGYAVMSGLINFQTHIGSKQINPKKTNNPELNPQAIEQFKFEEVRSVYSRLEATLKAVEKQDTDMTNIALSNIMCVYNPKIEMMFDDKTLNKMQSLLLKNIVGNIDSHKNYTDILRKRGIKLVDLVKEKGSFVRPYDFLNEDYKSIATVFAPKTVYNQ